MLALLRAGSGATKGKPRKVATPGKRTIEEVSAFLAIDPATLIKTLLFETSVGDVAVLVSGAHEVNEIKVKNHLGAEYVRLAGEERVREMTGAPSGFAGPVGLSVRTIADHSVRSIASGATGANEKDVHLVDVVPGRDFIPEGYADLRVVREGDPCPRCGGALRFSRGIEVGHVFRLGTKYSEAMRAVYLDEGGRERVTVMGCYGIGVGRTAAAAIEQNHDDDGIVWPISIAPFEVAVIPVNVKQADVMAAAERVAADLDARGVEVFFDDREERPGIKFKDADLTGIPRAHHPRGKERGGRVRRDPRPEDGETIRVPLTDLANEAIALVERKKAGAPHEGPDHRRPRHRLPEAALATVKALSGEVGMFKVGMERFPSGWPELVRRIREAGFDVFLDLKFHDIPNTVAGAVRSAAALGVKFATVHASGGRAMLTAAAESARGTGTTILAVTVLTSLDDADLADVGFSLDAAEAVGRLADLAVSCGVKGIVCSAKEVEAVRARVGKGSPSSPPACGCRGTPWGTKSGW